jgi:spore coat protein CotH
MNIFLIIIRHLCLGIFSGSTVTGMYIKNKFQNFLYAHFHYLLILFFIPSLLCAQTTGDSVFNGIQVHTIKLQFNQPNYWDSLTYFYDKGNEQYLAAAVTIDSLIVLDSVGVRLKGNSSYSHPNNKKSMKLNFDEYRDKQRWDGLKGVHLNNCFSDPSFMREKIHFDFCRDANIPAPRANYAMVYINNEVWGLYTLVEQVDKKFLSSRFGYNEGNLYKAVDGFGMGGQPGSNTTQILSDFKWYGNTESLYYTRYELKTNDSQEPWTDLVSAIDVVNNSSDVISSITPKINLTNLYKAISTDILFANLDSYVESGRNFYIYFNPSSGKMEWIVWDANMSFGGFPGNRSKAEELSLTYLSSTSNRPLVGKIFNTTDLKKNYLRTFYTIFNKYFSSERLFPYIDSIANIIRPYVNSDTKKQYTLQQFESNVESDITVSGGFGGPGGPGGGNERKPGIKSFITTRYANIKSQFLNLNIDSSNTINPGDIVINEFMAQNTSTLDPAGQPDDWIELYNNTSKDIYLEGICLSDSSKQLTKWKFPDNAIVSAKSYLIIWADNDSGQTGIHSNFKLSLSGEQIILSDVDGNILDSVSYGTQIKDKSMARIPNGSGSFKQSAPTFNQENKEFTSVVEDTDVKIPNEYYLSQNYPNPFNPSTTIKINLPKTTKVTITVFNILGERQSILVNNKIMNAGMHSVNFSAAGLSAGIYLYQLKTDDFVQIKKMILLQ